jgi:hypothetical protein
LIGNKNEKLLNSSIENCPVAQKIIFEISYFIIHYEMHLKMDLTKKKPMRFIVVALQRCKRGVCLCPVFFFASF